jgi:hypothetical protein
VPGFGFLFGFLPPAHLLNIIIKCKSSLHMWPVASKVFSILVTKGAVVWSSPLFVCGVIVN